MRVVGKLKLIDCYRFATTRAENQGAKPIGHLISPLRHQVPVNVHRDVDRRVPHERLDALRVLAVGDEQACEGVPQILKPDLA
ncbi:MAG: hypothetical protein ACREXX_15715 [Gammaproteobacteria bacterium]